MDGRSCTPFWSCAPCWMFCLPLSCRCASASGLAHKATSKSGMNALRTICTLVQGLSCFFIFGMGKDRRCVDEPFVHGYPCGKRVRWSSQGRRLTDLARAPVCRRATGSVNAVFATCLLQFRNRSQLFIRTHDDALSTVATGVRPSTGMLETTVASQVISPPRSLVSEGHRGC